LDDPSKLILTLKGVFNSYKSTGKNTKDF